ncbi:hypothetical protein OG921_04730 [Aldersonia sp. NBC_00410]|uniref:hypothetical protein n=1 Tax=Aldersonia sp. NBC_00410 TaxID=2975954 RepID=UPI00224E4C41|nr:hypothetical protein [Aldersonia sp. NBC_00410]MCX5042477.1 hypothetical protein [Aldersonia sp. NBC_00410]
MKTLNSDKIGAGVQNVVDEVLAHLRSGENTSVTVRIEIEATDSQGFNESRVRTVSENARTLKFDQSGSTKAESSERDGVGTDHCHRPPLISQTGTGRHRSATAAVSRPHDEQAVCTATHHHVLARTEAALNPDVQHPTTCH